MTSPEIPRHFKRSHSTVLPALLLATLPGCAPRAITVTFPEGVPSSHGGSAGSSFGGPKGVLAAELVLEDIGAQDGFLDLELRFRGDGDAVVLEAVGEGASGTPKVTAFHNTVIAKVDPDADVRVRLMDRAMESTGVEMRATYKNGVSIQSQVAACTVSGWHCKYVTASVACDEPVVQIPFFGLSTRSSPGEVGRDPLVILVPKDSSCQDPSP